MFKIEPDKLGHLVLGFLVTSPVTPLGILISLLVVLAVGIGKEIYDAFNPQKHFVEFLDIVYTLIGGLLAIGVHYIVMFML